MVDITKCSGLNCPIKLKCKRFKQKPGLMQSYFVELPFKIDEINGKKMFSCDMFWSDAFDLESVIFD